MKSIILTIAILSSYGVYADQNLQFQVTSPNFLGKCSGKKLEMFLRPLLKYSEMKTAQVYYEAESAGLCDAALRYIHSGKTVEVTLKTTIRQQKDLMELHPCFLGNRECTAIYRRASWENISVKMRDVEFKTKGIIPGTETRFIETWDSADCPPNNSNCDL